MNLNPYYLLIEFILVFILLFMTTRKEGDLLWQLGCSVFFVAIVCGTIWAFLHIFQVL